MTAVLIIFAVLSAAAHEADIIVDVMEQSGFVPEQMNFKKDFGVNEYYCNAQADSILNNPLLFFDFRDSMINAMHTSKTDIYSDIDNVYELIDKYSSDITDILRNEIPLNFDKSVSIVSLIPLLFYEDSMDYLYRGAIERNINATADICTLDAESLFAYLRDCKPVTDSMEMLSYAFVSQIERLYINGMDIGIDTFIDAGHVCIGTPNDDVYSLDYDFIIEPGGNDQYVNQCCVVYPYTKRVKCIIDFSGNDSYSSTDSFSVSLGAVNGVSLIYDFQGDDIYRTYNFSQGAAFVGLSMLIDCRGNDLYSAGIFSQGAGAFGKGILIDKNGDDIYTGSAYNQGMGFVRGTGILVDSTGNDIYRSGTFIPHKPLLKDDYLAMGQGFGMGLRPDYAGGIGILLDNAGSDIYNASVFGQGSAYWHAIGMLIDNEGNDYYTGAEYLQGAGIHLAAGGMFDNRGDDMYYSRYGPSQGEGHDYGIGILVDSEGNDNYTVSGGQGVGLANGIGIFIDKKGRDNYFTTENVHNGHATLTRGFYGYGIFIDLEEHDFYAQGNNKGIVEIKHIYGLKYDDTVSVAVEYPDTFDIDQHIDIEKLFDMAAMWQVREVIPLVDKARNMLNKRKDAFDYIIDNKMDTQSGLELRAIVSFFEENADKHGDELIALLGSEDEQTLKNAIYIIGKIDYNKAYDDIKALTSANNESLVLNAVHTIGLLETDNALNYLIDIYKDTDNYRIKIEVLTALTNHKEDFHELFLNEFSDNEQVNYALADYLSGIDDAVSGIIAKENKDFNDLMILYLYLQSDEEHMQMGTLQEDDSDNARIQFLKNEINSIIE